MSSTTNYQSFTIDHDPKFGSDSQTSKDLIVLPGLLGYGGLQIEPLREEIRKKGYRILPLSYTPGPWDSAQISTEVVQLVRRLMAEDRQLTLFGISLGGLLSAMAVKYLDDNECSTLRFVAVDTPYGAETMKTLPSFARPLFTKGWYRLFNGVIGDELIKMIFGPPKASEIVLPAHLKDASSVEQLVYKEQVLASARAGMAGHTWQTVGGQLGWMAAKAQPDLTHLKRVGELSYIQCRPFQSENSVVEQPLAMQPWKEQLGAQMEFVTVPTDHCAFLTNPEPWIDMVRTHL